MTEQSQEHPQHRTLNGEAEYEAAIDEVISHAERTLHIFDVDLSSGGYSSLKRYESLRAFLMKSRANRLVLVLHETDFLERHCPRLMNLIKLHSHAVSVSKTQEHARIANNPVVIADEAHYVHRFHVDGARAAVALGDHAGARQLEERFEQLLEASSQVALAGALGL